MPIAFFDLDRTLLSVNSGSLWVRSELRQGYLTRWQAARATVWIAGYHLGFSRLEPILEEAIATLAGSPESDVRDRTLRFYADEVEPHYRPRAREAVERHRAAGDTLALLTSSSPYLTAPVQTALGIPHVLCNRFEVVDGTFTGRPEGPLCFGPGKLVHAKAFCEAHGERLEDAWFYTDSTSDLSVLEAVGHPVAVHPDPTLRRIAKKRSWPVEDWGEAGA